MSFVNTSVLKNSTIMLLHAEKSEINLNPEYQRMGGIWTLEKRRLLIDSIINDYDIPKLYFHLLDNDEYLATGYRYAVIDGRQRLETIWNFIDGDFTLSNDIEYQRDNSIILANLTYSDIAKQYPKIRIKFDSFVLPVVTVEVQNNDLDLIEDMFSRLNEAVPLNAAEKRNAIGGDMVRAINEISDSSYFLNNVKFTPSRYRYREISGRFLLIEESIINNKNLIDAKKVYLDNLVEHYKNGHTNFVKKLKDDVLVVLDAMSKEFAQKDELLAAQSMQTVYYLVFRTAINQGELSKITRSKLLDFRRNLAQNRDIAAKDYGSASYELLEFDRASQQGTNDASSIRDRYHILCRFMNLTPDILVN